MDIYFKIIKCFILRNLQNFKLKQKVNLVSFIFLIGLKFKKSNFYGWNLDLEQGGINGQNTLQGELLIEHFLI